jgi:phosphoglycolate phosphatase-like HAD superfamily hydrolase
MKYKAILFDFDGVIVDSMELKLDSYCYAFEGYNINKNEIRKMQINNAGFSRNVVIRNIYNQYISQVIKDTELQNIIDRFCMRDRENSKKIPLITSTMEFLERISGNYFTAVITGTPQPVIEETVKRLGIGKHFNCILGSPKLKSEHISDLIKETKYLRSEYMFIGDSKNDQEAAINQNIRFIGFSNDSSVFEKNDNTIFSNDLRYICDSL